MQLKKKGSTTLVPIRNILFPRPDLTLYPFLKKERKKNKRKSATQIFFPLLNRQKMRYEDILFPLVQRNWI